MSKEDLILEPLSKKRIEKELISTAVVGGLAVCIIWAMIGCLFLLFNRILNKPVFTVMFIAFSGCLLYAVINAIITIVKVKNKRYTITLDRVVKIKPGHGEGGMHLFSKPNIIHFSSGKKFSFYNNYVFYQWSDLFKTNARNLINGLRVGDEFYTVSLGDKYLRYIYKTGFFELEE